MSLPVTVLGPPNAVVEIQPGMNIQPVCVIAPPSGAVLVTGQGGKSNVSVSVQPGMNVRAVCLVSSAGQLGVTFP